MAEAVSRPGEGSDSAYTLWCNYDMLGLINIRFLGVVALVLFGGLLTFLMYNGLINIKRDSYACLGGKHYINASGRQRLVGIGPLNVYYQPVKWDCDKDHQFDSTKYRAVGGGQLEPIQ